MNKMDIRDLINISSVQKTAEHLYSVSGIPVGITDCYGEIVVSVGWQDICTRYHRVHPIAKKRCIDSNINAINNFDNFNYIEHKCYNNLRDVAYPIIVLNEHIGTLFIGQFFYDDEVPDVECFKRQAIEYGFDINEYISAVKKVPRFSKEKVYHMMEYYKELVLNLAESSILRIQQKKAQEELLISENRMRNLLQSMKDTVFVMDSQGVFTEYYNSPIMPLLFPPEYFIGKNYKEILDANLSELTTIAITKLRNEEIAQPYEYPVEAGDKTIWCSAQMSKIIGKEGKPEGYITVVRDITEKKSYEEKLLKAKREAEASNDIKSMFIANISHELRTPINVILSAIQLFELKNKNNNLFYNDKNFKSIKQNCYRLLRITNNLIDITKIESGFMNLHLKNVNIVNIVEDITLSVAEYAKSKKLNFQFDTEIEEKIMAVDPDKLERIVLNLLSNAIKCTKENGSVFVNIFDKSNCVIISFKDTGIGIPEEKLNNIFERFIQVENSLIKSHEGSGIGLSIVQSFVKMHCGNIKVISKVGVGTEFIVELPVRFVNNDEHKQNNLIKSNDNYVEMLNVEFSDIYL